jgi:hypothetical protein
MRQRRKRDANLGNLLVPDREPRRLDSLRWLFAHIVEEDSIAEASAHED